MLSQSLFCEQSKHQDVENTEMYAGLKNNTNVCMRIVKQHQCLHVHCVIIYLLPIKLYKILYHLLLIKIHKLNTCILAEVFVVVLTKVQI